MCEKTGVFSMRWANKAEEEVWTERFSIQGKCQWLLFPIFSPCSSSAGVCTIQRWAAQLAWKASALTSATHFSMCEALLGGWGQLRLSSRAEISVRLPDDPWVSTLARHLNLTVLLPQCLKRGAACICSNKRKYEYRFTPPSTPTHYLLFRTT